MKKILLFIILMCIPNLNLLAQKMDTDSLLVKTLYEINTTKNYAKAIEMARLGLKNAPDYLDFHLALGRTYMLTQKRDSSRVYLNFVINKNPVYKEAFIYLAQLEIEEKNTLSAMAVIDKALMHYPEDKDFYLLKLKLIQIEKDDEKSVSFLNDLIKKYPSDADLRQQLIDLKYKSVSDRLGINYNFTTFDRDGIGPWHLLGFQYIRERKKLSLIGRINYADRYASGKSISSGFQYEMETYFQNNKRAYSYVNLAYSPDIVFPEFRISYSYFLNLNKGWEGDLGLRYTKTTDQDLYATVLGVGKYIGSYWLNFRSYLQLDEHKIHPAFTATARYYFDTKYDYATVISGYGSSPDERVSLGEFQQRVSLDSFRIGLGYYKLLWQHYCAGLQAMLNRQEYAASNFQNEFDMSFSIQYKF